MGTIKLEAHYCGIRRKDCYLANNYGGCTQSECTNYDTVICNQGCNMNYCYQKGIGCPYANSNGNCVITGCIKHDSYQTIIYSDKPIYSNKINFNNYNTCIVCGAITNINNDYLCNECAYRMRKLVYGDENEKPL